MDLHFETDLTEKTASLTLYRWGVLTELLTIHDTSSTIKHICLFHRNTAYASCLPGFWLLTWTEKSDNTARDEIGICGTTE